jgi:hypothetical protein
MVERDYSKYIEVPAGSDLLNRIAATAAEQERLMNELNDLARLVKEKEEELRVVSDGTLPDLMDQAGLKEFVTLSGTKIKIQELVTASCPAPSTRDPELMKRRSRIFKWLDDNGYGKLISRELKVEFDRSQSEQALALEKELRDQKYSVQRQYAVHPQTFNKFARDMLADGKELPEDFHIHRRNVAKIVKD